LSYDWLGYEVKAIYVGPYEAASLIPPEIRQLDSLSLLNEYVTKNGVHEVWITLPLNASEHLAALQSELHDALVDIRWIPDPVSMLFLSNRLIDFMGTAAVDLNQPAVADMRGILKEIFDSVFALAALILLAPLLLAIALGIKLTSPGPVLFRQARLGLNGRKFNVYKFRSMHVHDESGNLAQARRGDPRVTRFGMFLRRTSLDELPQFINVLKGDMSVVGPRPHAVQHNDFYRAQLQTYMLRHRVKPGITGWAQVNGCRGETDTLDKMARRIQLDIHYIQHWSFLMDLKIIAWTALRGWTGNNAY
jgi:putative colanic acid biosynthesis UDP-glucose lipid carrier transferase